MNDEKYSLNKICNKVIALIKDYENKKEPELCLELIKKCKSEDLASFIINEQAIISFIQKENRKINVVKFYESYLKAIKNALKDKKDIIFAPYLFEDDINSHNIKETNKITKLINDIDNLSRLKFSNKVISNTTDKKSAYQMYVNQLNSILNEVIKTEASIGSMYELLLISDCKKRNLLHVSVKLKESILTEYILKSLSKNFDKELLNSKCIKDNINESDKENNNNQYMKIDDNENFEPESIEKNKNDDNNIKESNIINKVEDYVENEKNKLNAKLVIDYRDIYLRTPLHYACQLGNIENIMMLLDNYANSYALDSINRNIFHYALSGNSLDLVKLILDKFPELVMLKDNYNRTPFHYLLFSESKNRQLISDIISTFIIEKETLSKKILNSNQEADKNIIKAKEFINEFNIDVEDDYGKTPLHYASEKGKDWIIYDLLSIGANPTYPSSKTGLSSIQLAKDERIRNMILVAYASKDLACKFIPKSKIIKYNGSLSKKETNDIYNKAKNDVYKEIYEKKRLEAIKTEEYYKEVIFNINSNKKNIKKSMDNKFDEENNNELFDKDLYKAFTEERKIKVTELLNILQTSKLVENQHLKNPQFFSGSWLSEVNSTDELINKLGKMKPSDAILWIYNILDPMSFNKLENTQKKLQQEVSKLQNNNKTQSINSNNYNNINNSYQQGFLNQNKYFVNQQTYFNHQLPNNYNFNTNQNLNQNFNSIRSNNIVSQQYSMNNQFRKQS